MSAQLDDIHVKMNNITANMETLRATVQMSGDTMQSLSSSLDLQRDQLSAVFVCVEKMSSILHHHFNLPTSKHKSRRRDDDTSPHQNSDSSDSLETDNQKVAPTTPHQSAETADHVMLDNVEGEAP